MAITLEEYLRKHEELTLQEQENKINYGKVIDEIEQTHRRHQQRELDTYHDARMRAKESYMEQVQELQRQKRELKTERLLTYQQEQIALGKEISNQ